jgi:hypothetical protein
MYNTVNMILHLKKHMEGKLLPLHAQFFHKNFKTEFNELITKSNLSEYIFLIS